MDIMIGRARAQPKSATRAGPAGSCGRAAAGLTVTSSCASGWRAIRTEAGRRPKEGQTAVAEARALTFSGSGPGAMDSRCTWFPMK